MKKTINFGVQKTENEWQQEIDEFYLKFIPKWFDFLNWIVLLGIFHFLAEYTQDWKLRLIYAISMIGLWMFLQSYFFNFHLEGLPLMKSKHTKRLFSLIIGGIISTSVFSLLNNIIPQINGKV